jgi:hypothetical protein
MFSENDEKNAEKRQASPLFVFADAKSALFQYT